MATPSSRVFGALVEQTHRVWEWVIRPLGEDVNARAG